VFPTPSPTPLFATPLSTATVTGVVFSTSSELTQEWPQQTERTRRWLAAVNKGITNFTTRKVTIEKAVPTPPATNVWLESPISTTEMPYELVKVGRRYAVKTVSGPNEGHLHGLTTKAKASAQLRILNRGLMKGGARSTTEAASGLVLHPTDSIDDFKSLFSELTKIWNNGKIGEGLRSHGIPVVNLVIKYLPLAGAPGVAAATALEKLQISKWINLLASLIDFVSGDGNIMTFLNALKDLVGDLFKQLGDVLLDVARHPEKIGNAIKGGFDVATNAVQNIFEPGRAEQQAEYAKNESQKSAEQSAADDIIASMKSAADTYFENNKPQTFDDAAEFVAKFHDHQYPPIEVDSQITDAINEFKLMAQDPTIQSKGGNFQTQQARVEGAQILYAIPYLLYMRDNWQSRPEKYQNPDKKTTWNGHIGKWEQVKPLQEIPSWDESTFANKAIDRTTPFYGSGPKPKSEFDTFLDSFIDGINAINSTEAGYDANDPATIQREKEQKDATEKRDRERAEQEAAAREADTPANRVKRGNIAIRHIFEAMGWPVPWEENNGPIRSDGQIDPAMRDAIPFNMGNFVTSNPYVQLWVANPTSATQSELDKIVTEIKKWIPKQELPSLMQFQAPQLQLPPMAIGGRRPYIVLGKRPRSHYSLSHDFFE